MVYAAVKFPLSEWWNSKFQNYSESRNEIHNINTAYANSMLATASGRPVTQTGRCLKTNKHTRFDSAASRPGKLPGFRDQDSDFRNEVPTFGIKIPYFGISSRFSGSSKKWEYWPESENNSPDFQLYVGSPLPLITFSCNSADNSL